MYRPKLFIGFLLLMFTNFVIGAENSGNKTPVSDPAKTIMVEQKAPQFTIVLASNPTTGYSWFIQQYDPALVQVVKRVYHPPVGTLVGAGGSETWTFKLKSVAFVAPHILTVKLLYARAWDVADNAKEAVFTITSSVMEHSAGSTSS